MIRLTWATASEIDTAGFHICRRTGANSAWTLITDTLIPAEGGPSVGANYTYDDLDIEPGRIYAYQLEELDNAGNSLSHGPVEAWAGVVNIRANEADGPVNVAMGAPVSVTVQLQTGDLSRTTNRCWIAAETAFGWYSYDGGWAPGIRPVRISLLNDTDPVTVLNMSLPAGEYAFYLVVGQPANGSIEEMWMDQVPVTVW